MKVIQFLATLTSSLVILSGGIHEAWTSVYIPKLLDDTETITITNEEGSWITLSLNVGGVVGCLLASVLSDRIGRKKTILLTSIPNILTSVILAFATSVHIFCIARFLSGLAYGIASAVIPHYIGEIADPDVRGTLGTFVSIFSITGLLSINVLGYFVSIPVSSWITAVIPIVFLITFIWMPESPYYLVMIGELNEAKKSLVRLKGTDDVCNELKQLTETTVQQMKTTKIKELFKEKGNKRALFIVFLLLNGKQLTGIGPIDAYAQLIFQQMFTKVSPLFITLIYYVTRFVMILFSSFVTYKVGRKPLLIGSFIGCFFSLLFLSIYLHIQKTFLMTATIYPLICVEAYAISYSFMTSIPLSVLGELFPMNVKMLSSIFYVVYLYISTFVVIKCFQELSDNFGVDIPFFVFSVSCLIHLILFYKYVFETKGKTLQEIQICLAK